MPDCFVVAIVDDDEAVRRSTAGLLKRAGHSIQTYADGAEFLAADLGDEVGCILLDMRMPRVDGLAVMRSLRERGITTPILVLTGHGDVPLAVEAMRLGAVDFLEKPYPSAELRDAIDRACAAPRAASGAAIDPEAKAKVDTLSKRQRSVLAGILKGQPNKIIAWELSLSIRTVEAYRAQLLDKLHVHGTAEAVRLAIAAGMLLE